MKLSVYFTRSNDKIPTDIWDSWLSQLTDDLKTKNGHYYFQIDRQRHLLGLLLLNFAWKNYFNIPFRFDNLRITKFSRPYLQNGCADFNISHSGDYVGCVVSSVGKVGLDIEVVKEINFANFARTMSPAQWNEINKSQDPLDLFFRYWTMKESVIKADGRGLSIPLTSINFVNDLVSYDGSQWHLYPFKIGLNHNGCVASNYEIKDMQLVEVHWKEFVT